VKSGKSLFQRCARVWLGCAEPDARAPSRTDIWISSGPRCSVKVAVMPIPRPDGPSRLSRPLSSSVHAPVPTERAVVASPPPSPLGGVERQSVTQRSYARPNSRCWPRCCCRRRCCGRPRLQRHRLSRSRHRWSRTWNHRRCPVSAARRCPGPRSRSSGWGAGCAVFGRCTARGRGGCRLASEFRQSCCKDCETSARATATASASELAPLSVLDLTLVDVPRLWQALR